MYSDKNKVSNILEWPEDDSLDSLVRKSIRIALERGLLIAPYKPLHEAQIIEFPRVRETQQTKKQEHSQPLQNEAIRIAEERGLLVSLPRKPH